MKNKRYILLLIFLLIFSAIHFEKVFQGYSFFDVFNTLIFSLIYMLPIGTTFILGEKNYNKNINSRKYKIYVKMISYSIIPAALSTILWSALLIYLVNKYHLGEIYGITGFFPINLVISIFIFSILSLFLTRIIYLNKDKSNTLICIILILGTILFSSLTIIRTNEIGFGGTEKRSLGEFAYNKRDPSICERGGVFYKDPHLYLSLSGKKTGEIYECYTEYAKISNDISICERIGPLDRHMCFYEFESDNLNCDSLQKKDSKSSCYFILALKTSNKDLCKNVEPLVEFDERLSEELYKNRIEYSVKNINKEFCEKLPKLINIWRVQ